MIDKIKKQLSNKITWILFGIGIFIGILYGIFVSPFFLHFLDGITITGFLLLLFTVIHFWWADGTFAITSWKKETDGNLMDYRDQIRKERQKQGNPFLIPSFLLILFSIVLTVIYYILVI